MEAYTYVIIKENYPELERLSTLLDNNYKKTKKYAFIMKCVHKDSSESITSIKYSNDMVDLQSKANGFISWYNYTMKLKKNIQGFISELN